MKKELTESTILLCEDAPRPKWFQTQYIKTTRIDFDNKQDATFWDDEPITLNIHWTNLLDIRELCLLIEITSLDDVAQASYVLYDFYSGPKGKIVHIKLQLDTGGLMDAKYQMRFTFFTKNTFGTGITVDSVKGLCFTKKNTNNGSELIWVPKAWGYIQLPRPEIKILEHKE